MDNLIPVAKVQSHFGKVNLFRHPELGKVFVINNEIQHVEAWAPLYHEPLVHLSGAFVPKIKDVLILGGGTLYAASEVLKYKSVQRVVLFDHDPRITELVAGHYDHATACLNDTRLVLIHRDAYSALGSFRDQFDLVINDGVDLLDVRAYLSWFNPSRNLFSAMKATLRPNGVCADVVYRHVFEARRTRQTIQCLARSNRLALSLVFLPEYHGVLHLLCIWGKRFSHVKQHQTLPKNREQLQWRNDPESQPCDYYDPRFLRYYLYLPRYLQKVLRLKK